MPNLTKEPRAASQRARKWNVLPGGKARDYGRQHKFYAAADALLAYRTPKSATLSSFVLFPGRRIPDTNGNLWSSLLNTRPHKLVYHLPPALEAKREEHVVNAGSRN